MDLRGYWERKMGSERKIQDADNSSGSLEPLQRPPSNTGYHPNFQEDPEKSNPIRPAMSSPFSAFSSYHVTVTYLFLIIKRLQPHYKQFGKQKRGKKTPIILLLLPAFLLTQLKNIYIRACRVAC